MANARATQAPVLVLGAGPEARITQGPVLVLSEIQAEAARATQVPALALAEGASSARVTQGPVLVLADSTPCLTQWAECWKITRRDGEVFAFTSLDRDVEFRGVTYKACDSLSASAMELGAMLGETGNLELAGIISDDSIREDELFAGLFDGADVEVWMVPWKDDGTTPWRMAVGRTGKMSQGDRGFKMEVLTFGALLQQQALVETYTPSCRWDLGDSRCTVALGPLTVSGTVESVAGRAAGNAASHRIFTDSSRGEADGYFDLGLLTWTGGANAGAQSEVKSFAGGQFVLWAPMLHPIQVGDTYEVHPGCDKSPDTCKSKFSNYVNFGGFPDVPGRDSISRAPDAKG